MKLGEGDSNALRTSNKARGKRDGCYLGVGDTQMGSRGGRYGGSIVSRDMKMAVSSIPRL